MPLTPQEQAELQALEAELSPQQQPQQGLSPEEQQELAMLEKEMAPKAPLAQFPVMQEGLNAATTRIQDTMQMSKPDMQGPPMPPTMPPEIDAAQYALGVAAGQTPVPGGVKPRIDPFTKKPIQAVAKEASKAAPSGIGADLATLILGRRAPAAKRLMKVLKKGASKAGARTAKAGLESLLIGGQASTAFADSEE